MNKIQKFNGDMYELALVRYVMKEAASLFYRDYTFFLNKENIKARDSIYNRDIDLTDVNDFSIVCKSYCNTIRDLLKQLYNIDSEVISSCDDRFRHVDLLIKTNDGNRYIVDPLTDLVEMQVGMKTNNFASRKYYESVYAETVPNVKFLTETELEQIDDNIGYKKENVYLDDLLDEIRREFDENQQLSDDEKTMSKLRYIIKLNNRKNLRGFVELVIFSETVISKVFSKEEQNKIHKYSFFVDEIDLHDLELENILASSNSRKRGRVINFNGKNFVISLNKDTVEYDDSEWKEKVKENNIFIKPEYPVKLLKYFKTNGADRNIVHNNEFLRLFNKFETILLKSGKTIEELKEENVFIQKDMILTKIGNKYISYKIEDGNLVIKDYLKNNKHIVFYDDEGRSITSRTEPILKENEKVQLHEFDSNGLIDLDDATGIEDLVAPLKNGKYLSRNESYYESKTYSELSQKRKELRSILTEDFSKKNFVILEYLSNSSAKVYFEELKKKIENQENNVLMARKCLEEDCENIVRFFEKRPLLKPIYDLPEGEDRVLSRHIEMDNKQMLYLFCSNLRFSKPKHVLNPGLGAILIGPILKSMYGFDYTNILFSLYSKDEKLKNISEQKSFEDMTSDNLWKDTDNQLILIDDNTSSCSTLNRIIQELKLRNKTCKFGAVKYNWDFYNQVKHGQLDHPTFDVKKVDFLTILDEPGYWVMRDSINALKEEGGDAYIQVMKEEGLRQENVPDIITLMQLTEKHSKKAGVDLYDMESGNIKKSSAFLCKNLKEEINEITRDAMHQDRSRDE